MQIYFGVPQGSNLGPLLLQNYTNDFYNSLSNLDAIHFADDTTPYKDIDSSIDTINVVIEELT